MRVKDIMTTPAITVRPGTPVKEAAALLVDHGISAVPVVDDAEELVGIVSEGDLIPLEAPAEVHGQIRQALRRTRPTPRTVEEVMTRRVVTLPGDADATQVAKVMLDTGVKSIPIVSGDHVVGIVARRDVLKILARSDGDIRRDVEALLDDELLMLGHCSAGVSGGVVTLTTPHDERRLAALLARSVPGVLEVEFAEGPA
ncbi:MAG TPA: CBS domain-containing protein [Actinomycetota bacterium]